MLITPFDRSAIAAIEKVIREADLGVNPSNDGNSIRVVMPQLTEERRKEYIKLARAKAEDARIAVRNIRRHSIDALKKLEYNGFWRVSDVLEATSHGYDGYVFDENMNKLEFKGYRVDRINDFAYIPPATIIL